MATLHEDQYTFFIISCSVLFRMRNFSGKSYRQSQNKHFIFKNFFFFKKPCHLWDNVEKYSRAEVTDDSMVHARCMLNTEVYTYTLRSCNICCFSTATMVAQMCIIVTLYIHCLSCSLMIRSLYFGGGG